MKLSQELYNQYKALGNDHLAKVEFIKKYEIDEFELFLAKSAIKPEGFITGDNPFDPKWNYKVDIVKSLFS